MLEVETMTRQQAQKEAQKRWGKRAMIRVGELLSSPDKRAEAQAILKRNRERRDAIDHEVNERLNAMDWYRELMAERKACVRAVSEAQGWAAYYKFKVGRDVGIAFSVDGCGDTWEAAFADAERQKALA
jgi:hypothetical protein